MHFEIVTPEKVVLKEEVDEIIAPTADGVIGILPHHINLLTQVIHGEMEVKIKNKWQYLAVTGGFLEVNDNSVTLLADYAIRAEDINAEKVLDAQKRAEQILKQKRETVSERDFAFAESDLHRTILELKVVNRRVHHRSS